MVNLNKAPYQVIYLSGDNMPTIDYLAEKAIETMDYADGYSFDCTNASLRVKLFVESNHAAVLQRVFDILKAKEDEEMFGKAKEMSVLLAPLFVELEKLREELKGLRETVMELRKNGPKE